MTTAQRLTRVAENVPKVYASGQAAAERACAKKHFATAFVGDGTDTATFNVPFAPDVMLVSGVHPFHATASGNNMVAMLVFDLRAFGLLGGTTLYGNASTNSKIQTTMFTTTSMLNRYNRADDGTVTITCTSPSVFVKGFTYMVTAAKALNQSDKERIEEFVQGLAGTGSVTLNKAKVNAAFTDAEWAALIARAPGWTFSFI